MSAVGHKRARALSRRVPMGPDHPGWAKPVRRGETYCAPFCGRGCLWASYKEAVSRADQLAHLLGKGWRPVVHENLGWHWRAVSPCGQIKVVPGIIWRIRRGDYVPIVTSYTAFFGEIDFPGGDWAEEGSSPGRAVNEVIAAATRRRNEIDRRLSDARRAGSGPR